MEWNMIPTFATGIATSNFYIIVFIALCFMFPVASQHDFSIVFALADVFCEHHIEEKKKTNTKLMFLPMGI